MKKSVLAFLLFTGITLGVNAQEEKEVSSDAVPQAVKTSFTNRFADASDVEWKMKKSSYMASFTSNSVDHHAKLSNKGEIKAWGQKIEESAIPMEVMNSIKRDYPDYKIDKAMTVMEDGQTNYKVSLDGAEDKKVMYSASGKVLKEKDKD